MVFTTAVEAINSLTSARAQYRLKSELKKFLTPSILILDELGYLRIDKAGADLLFQIISLLFARYQSNFTAGKCGHFALSTFSVGHGHRVK